jgi:hypothetical protein
VGWRRNSGVYINYIQDYNGPSSTGLIWSSAGLDVTTSGQAYCVSSNGTVIFGVSPKTGSGPTNYAYKATFNATFPGAATQLSTTQLPNLPGATESTVLVPEPAIATNFAVPYGCTPDGKYAVGSTFTSAKKAVFWDTSDASSANWTVIDLTAVAAAAGILGNFTNLSCAYSVGTRASGEMVVAGIGDWSEDGGVTTNTRAFVLSFTPSTAPTPTRVTSFSIAKGPGSNLTLNYSGGTGSRFVLLQSSNVAAPLSGWTRALTNTATPGSFTITPGSDPREFYRVKSE